MPQDMVVPKKLCLRPSSFYPRATCDMEVPILAQKEIKTAVDNWSYDVGVNELKRRVSSAVAVGGIVAGGNLAFRLRDKQLSA